MAVQIRGFRGERWWVWVGMAVLLSGIVLLNLATALLNRIMPRERSGFNVAAFSIPEVACLLAVLLDSAVCIYARVAARAGACLHAECVMADFTAL